MASRSRLVRVLFESRQGLPGRPAPSFAVPLDWLTFDEGVVAHLVADVAQEQARHVLTVHRSEDLGGAAPVAHVFRHARPLVRRTRLSHPQRPVAKWVAARLVWYHFSPGTRLCLRAVLLPDPDNSLPDTNRKVSNDTGPITGRRSARRLLST